jgi:hypothetical protein
MNALGLSIRAAGPLSKTGAMSDAKSASSLAKSFFSAVTALPTEGALATAVPRQSALTCVGFSVWILLLVVRPPFVYYLLPLNELVQMLGTKLCRGIALDGRPSKRIFKLLLQRFAY